MQERLQATIPNSNKWHSEDVEAKAKALGMEKTEFVLNAVDMMMNFDEVFYQRIQVYSKGINIPEWLVIQNMLINAFADNAAKIEVEGQDQEVLDEFVTINDGTGYRMQTGEELFNRLKKKYIKGYEKRLIPTLENYEKCGIPLTERNKLLLDKHKNKA